MASQAGGADAKAQKEVARCPGKMPQAGIQRQAPQLMAPPTGIDLHRCHHWYHTFHSFRKKRTTKEEIFLSERECGKESCKDIFGGV